MLAFDEVWPSDIPVVRPIHLDLLRPCVVDERGPVHLMPMHRRGRGIEGRADNLFPQPPLLRRQGDGGREIDRFCLEDEARFDGEKAVEERCQDWNGRRWVGPEQVATPGLAESRDRGLKHR